MRRINSDFQTLHISEEGQKLSNRDYFGYVEMDDFACYVLADSLDDEPAVNRNGSCWMRPQGMKSATIFIPFWGKEESRRYRFPGKRSWKQEIS